MVFPCRHFYGTFATFSELSPLLRNFRNFWVVFTFFTFPSPLQVAFASTLTYDPHHDLQHPPQLTGGEHLVFPCRHVYGTFATFATFSELSPLLGCVHLFHVPFATPPCFCFHTDLQSPPRPPVSSQLTGGEHLVFPCRHFYGTFATFATFSELSPLLQNFRNF